MEEQNSFYVIEDGGSRRWHPDLESAIDYVRYAFDDADTEYVKIVRAETIA